MANFFKIKETPDTELIINIDKIKMMQKTPTIVDVLMGIFGQMFNPQEKEDETR